MLYVMGILFNTRLQISLFFQLIAKFRLLFHASLERVCIETINVIYMKVFFVCAHFFSTVFKDELLSFCLFNAFYVLLQKVLKYVRKFECCPAWEFVY